MAYLASPVIKTPHDLLLAIDRTNLGSIIDSGAFMHVFTEEGEYKGQSLLFWAMRKAGTPYDALRIAYLPKDALEKIVFSPAFTHVIEEGEFRGESPLFWAIFAAGTPYDALRNKLAYLPKDALEKIVSSHAFTHVIEEVPRKGQSPLFWAMRKGGTFYDALRNALAYLPEKALEKIVFSPAFTHVIEEGEFRGESPLFWAMTVPDPFYDALRNRLASLPDALKTIVSSPAFTHVIEEGEFRGESPLFFAIYNTGSSWGALRNKLASLLKDALETIVSSHAFTHVFTKGPRKGESPLFWAIRSAGQFPDALRNALTSLPKEALEKILLSNAFTHVFTEGPYKGQSPLFWAICAAGPDHRALRNKLDSLPNALKKIVSSPAFTHVIEEGELKGQSPLFRAICSAGPDHRALRNKLASLPEEALEKILSSNAFTHVIEEGESRGESPLFWAICSEGQFYDALRNKLDSLPNALKTIVSSPAFTHVIEEGELKGQSVLFFVMALSDQTYDALRSRLASLPDDALKTIVSSPTFTQVIAKGDYKGESPSYLIMSREFTHLATLKQKIMALQKTMSLEKKYEHSENVIHRLNDFLKHFMPSSQCSISVTPSSEYHIVTEAQDDFHLQFLKNICVELKLIDTKNAVTTQTCDSPVKIKNTFVLAQLKTPTQFDFQQLLPIKRYNNVCQQTLMLIRYFIDALYSTAWEKFAVTCRLRTLPHSLSPFEVCVTNFPYSINGILTSLDLPDKRIDLNLAKIEEWLERFLKKFIALSNIGFTKDEVIKTNTTIALTLEPSFNINSIDKILALKESLRECFLSGSIKTINDEITSNIKQCKHIAFELNNQCYSIITSTFDTAKKEMFNQTTFSACFNTLPHGALDSLEQEITAITNTQLFTEKFQKARGDVRGSVEKVTESLNLIVQIDAYSIHCLNLLNRLIHDINTFHAQRISQTNNQCWYISAQQQRILRKITITPEDEQKLEKLNEQVIDAQNELNAIAFSFLNTQTPTLIHLKQRYDQLKKMPVRQHFEELTKNWEAVKNSTFFKPVCTLPKATLSSATTAKRVQVELPKFKIPASEGDYTQKLAALQAEHEKEMREEQQKRRDEKAQKANALELERQQVLKKPSSL